MVRFRSTYSCVGWWNNNRCETIANDHENRTTPSYVALMTCIIH